MAASTGGLGILRFWDILNLIKHTFIERFLSIRAELNVSKEREGGGRRKFLSIKIYGDADPKQIISIT